MGAEAAPEKEECARMIVADCSEKEDEGGDGDGEDADIESDSGDDSDNDHAAVSGVESIHVRMESTCTSGCEGEEEKTAMESDDKVREGLEGSPNRKLMDGIDAHAETHENGKVDGVGSATTNAHEHLPTERSRTLEGMEEEKDFPSLHNIGTVELSLLKAKNQNGGPPAVGDPGVDKSTTDLSVSGSRFESDGVTMAGHGTSGADVGSQLDNDANNDSVAALQGGSLSVMQEVSTGSASIAHPTRKKKTRKSTHHRRKGKAGNGKSRSGSTANGRGSLNLVVTNSKQVIGCEEPSVADSKTNNIPFDDETDSGGESDADVEGHNSLDSLSREGSLVDGLDSGRLDGWVKSDTSSRPGGVLMMRKAHPGIHTSGAGGKCRSIRSLSDNEWSKSGDLADRPLIVRMASADVLPSSSPHLNKANSFTNGKSVDTDRGAGPGGGMGSKQPSCLYEERMAMMQTVKASSNSLKAGLPVSLDDSLGSTLSATKSCGDSSASGSATAGFGSNPTCSQPRAEQTPTLTPTLTSAGGQGPALLPELVKIK
jgi:hypothetical protein